THAVRESGRPARRELAGVPAYLMRQFAGGMVSAVAWGLRGRLPAAVDRALDSALAAGYAASRWGFVRITPRATRSIAGSVWECSRVPFSSAPTTASASSGRPLRLSAT